MKTSPVRDLKKRSPPYKTRNLAFQNTASLSLSPLKLAQLAAAEARAEKQRLSPVRRKAETLREHQYAKNISPKLIFSSPIKTEATKPAGNLLHAHTSPIKDNTSPIKFSHGYDPSISPLKRTYLSGGSLVRNNDKFAEIGYKPLQQTFPKVSPVKRGRLPLPQNVLIKITNPQDKTRVDLSKGHSGSVDPLHVHEDDDHHVNADYHAMFRAYGTHMRAREALRREEKQAENNRARSLESNLNHYFEDVRGRVMDKVGKSLGGLPDRHVLPMTKMTVDYVPIVPPPPNIPNTQTLWYNSDMPDPSNPQRVPVYNNDRKQTPDYPEKSLNLSKAERKALRKSFNVHNREYRGVVDAANSNLTELDPRVGRSTLTLQLPYAHIKSLVYTNNKISAIDCSRMCCRFPQLTALNLGHCALECLPYNLGLLAKLKELRLHCNKLSRLPATLTKLCRLKILDVGGNNLITLPPGFWGLKELEELNANSNRLIKLPDGLQRCTRLQKVNFSLNKILVLGVFPVPHIRADTRDYDDDDVWEKLNSGNHQGYAFKNLRTHKLQAEPPSVAKWQHHNDIIGREIEASLEALLPPTRKEEEYLDFSKLLVERAPLNLLLKALAQANESVWGCAVNVENGLVYYTHAITKEMTFDMPPELDCVGGMTRMTKMKFNLNGIRALPESIGHMRQLVHLDLDSNRIRDIPISFCQLQSLELLSMANNLIERLPMQFGRLTSLTTLRMQYNAINFLPGSIGALKNIKSIWFGHNRIVTLPRPFARLTTLEQLELFDNPIVQPPMWVCEKGAKFVIKDMQQLLTEQQRGSKAPPVEILRIGVNNELLVPAPRLETEVDTICNGAETSGKIYMNWLDMKDFPKQLYAIAEKIQELRFVGHDLGAISRKIESFVNLRIVYLSANQITELPNVFSKCVLIEELFLSENLLTEIPPGICRLPKLRVLDLAHNRLQSVPRRLKTMRKLEVLNLNSNRLEEIPEGVGQMKSLASLSLASNKLRRVPRDMGELASITFINLNSNLLRKIPDSFARLGTLQELRLASNRLAALPKEIGRSVDVEVMYAQKEGENTQASPDPTKLTSLEDEYNKHVDAATAAMERHRDELKEKGTKKLLQIGSAVTKFLKHATRPDDHGAKPSFRGKAVSHVKAFYAKVKSNEKLLELRDKVKNTEAFKEAFREAAAKQAEMQELYNSTEFAKEQARRKRRKLREKKYKTSKYIVKGTLNKRLTKEGYLREGVKTKAALVQLLKREIREAEWPSSEDSDDEDGGEETGLKMVDKKVAAPVGVLEYKPSPLARSLRVLWLSGNNIRALPDSFGHFINMERLTLELNPIVSPPRIISGFGPGMLELYFSVKSKRFNTMVDELQRQKLVFDQKRLTPIAEGFWDTDDRGYVTDEDLDKFERAMNSYLNGEFYLFRFTPKKLIDEIIVLRTNREQEHFRLVLESFVELLHLISAERATNIAHLDDHFFVENAIQPWGQEGADVDCFGVDLDKLFLPMPSQDISIVEMYRCRKKFVIDQPHHDYQFERCHLELACGVFKRPYGRVASADAEVDFLGDWPQDPVDTEDEGKGGENKKTKKKKKKRHKKGELPPPDRRKAFVIQKFMYTDEEAARKADEDKGIERRHNLKLSRFYEYTLTPYGKKRMAKNNRLQRGGVSDTIGKEQDELGRRQETLRKARETLKAINERKEKFQAGQEFKFHNFRSEEAMEDAVDAAERVEEKAIRAINKQKEVIKSKRKLFKRNKKQWEEVVMKSFTDMIHKQVQEKVYLRHRRRARHKGFRRLWDGRNGEDYLAWLTANGPVHDEKSYSSPEDSSGFDIGVDSDEEKDRLAHEQAEAKKLKKREDFIRANLAEIKGCNPEDITEEDVQEMLSLDN